MIRTTEPRNYEYLAQLKRAHAAYLAAPPQVRAALARSFFQVCLNHWPLIRRFAWHGDGRLGEVRRRRRRLIRRLDPVNAHALLDASWQSYLWEALADFLNQYSPLSDDAGYPGHFCGFLGRTLDRSLYNLLTCELGWRPGLRLLSLSEPCDRQADGSGWEEVLVDGRAGRVDSSPFQLIQRATGAWVQDRTRRRPRQGRLYRAAAYAWWRNIQGELSVRELVETYGRRLCAPDRLYGLFRELAARVRQALHDHSLRDIPAALSLPADWAAHHLPDDDLDNLLAS